MQVLNSNPVKIVRTRGAARALVVGALSVFAIAAAREDSTSTRPAALTFYSDAEKLGNGTVKSYVTRNADGAVSSIGVELSESALQGLGTEHRMLHLPIPKQGASAKYSFVMLDWNPQGHEPDHVYTVPHFDFHFYMADHAEVAKIAGGPDPIVPDAKFIPQDYVSPGNMAVPGMGVHWVDKSAGELNGKPFDKTFLWGFTGGKLIFVEPMITKAFLESRQNFTTALKQPQAFQRAGLYPQRYSIRYDRDDRVYRISIDQLTSR